MAAADKNITIKFIADGDKDLINAFKQLATAQAKYNKESKATTGSAKKVNASFQTLALQVKNTVGSFKKLNVSQATINKAMNGNRVAIDKVRQAMKRLDVQQGKTRKGARLLDNAFATLRSKMLLFQFAMALGVRQLSDFAKEAAVIDDMSRAFNNLSGGTDKATVAIGKLKSATNGTMSEFDLFQQANNAMVLGVTKNSDEMAHMFDVAQRLGAALGKDTRHSVESLITGIGRQSRLMLDNIGIIVKSDEAYEKYAKSLDTTADKLTDAQKKQAFLTATMEAADKKLESVGEEVISYSARLQIASARMADMRVEIGNRLLPAFSNLALHFTDIGMIKGYGFALAGVGATFVALRAKMIAAAIANGTFIKSIKVGRATLIASGYGILFIALGELIGRFIIGKQKIDEQTESFKIQSKEVMVLTKSYKDLDKQKQKFIKAIKDEKDALDVPTPIDPSLSDREKKRLQGIGKLNEERRKSREEEKKREAEEVQALSEIIAHRQEFFRQQFEMRNMQPDFDIHEDAERFAQGLESQEEALARFRKKQEIHDATVLKSKLRSTSGMVDAFANMNEAMGGSAKASARLAQISASIDMYAGANKAFAQGGVMGFVTGAAIIAQGLANIAQISKGIDKFETGGLVGGRRHSQGGTLIEAERGEFVMSRNAVQAVGIEAMNRINQGGGAGSVNISFSGNVMSQDFIEGEAIPMIKEAIRRGADIGVS